MLLQSQKFCEALAFQKNFARWVHNLLQLRILAPPPTKMAKRNVRRSSTSPPQVLEPAWRQLGVTHSRRNAAMTKIGLQRSGICPFVCQGKPRRMPEHMRMDLERQLGLD
jgi:hypothetical protein